ncbi:MULTISPECIES: hypothetical protein [unclassified Mycolicibacterium]|uniref:hypothetical protein n=1 Tax=unclassified Mycolicibacterium TaxID=2636767 RepID=UPI002ED93039
MIRHCTLPAAILVALSVSAGIATADPAAPDGAATEVFTIGKCFDPSQPPPQRPAIIDYNCDNTGVLQDMSWSSWGAAGAKGQGLDSSVECQPNCAQGTRLVNPVVVHLWNPVASQSATCPPGLRFYSDMTIAYPQTAPPWINPGSEWSPGTDFVTVDGMPAVHFSGLSSNCEDQLR